MGDSAADSEISSTPVHSSHVLPDHLCNTTTAHVSAVRFNVTSPKTSLIQKSSSMVLINQKLNHGENNAMKSNCSSLTGCKSCGNVNRSSIPTEKEDKSQRSLIGPVVIASQTKQSMCGITSTMSEEDESRESTGKRDSSLNEFNNVLTKKVLLFGGTDPYNSSHFRQHQKGQSLTGQDVLFYDSYESEWKHLTLMPSVRHHHCAVLCKGRVYVVGGTRSTVGSPQKVIYENSVLSFDPHSLKWRNESSLPQPRRDFALVAIEDTDAVSHSPAKVSGLFVIGGEGKDGSALSSTFFYDVDKQIWIRKASLNIGRYGLSAAVVSNEIWIAGGITGIENPSDGSKRIPVVTDSIECYSIQHEGLWIQSSVRLRIPRFFTKLCHIPPYGLYIIGGITVSSDNQFTSLNSVDRFDFQSNNWRQFIEMRNSRHGHAAASLGERIIIVGGVSTVEKKTLSTVECFCTKRLKWVNDFAYLPQPLSSAALIVID